MTPLRVFFVGGVLSYRALFGFLTVWVFIPTLILTPIFQILLFAYIGRAAHLESDQFYVIGNSLQYAAVPCLFAMTQTIAGERFQQTLGYILISPAGRVSLFLGRALPVILNGFVVAAFSLVAGGLLLNALPPVSAFAPLAFVIAIATFSCTGLGLVNAALGLRIRENAVLSNVLTGLLLVFCGANVPTSSLPDWMSTVGSFVPLTHAIAAARRVAGGDTLGGVSGLLGRELSIGALYTLAGLAVIKYFELQSRRLATLERS